VRGCSREKLQATHGSGSTMSHISRALAHATVLLILPLDVSIAPRSAFDPASCMRMVDLEPLLRKSHSRQHQLVHCTRLSRATSGNIIR